MATDQQVWSQFVERVRSFVSRRVPADDVDDVLQEIFVRANHSLTRLREEKRAEAWILAIARKAIADFYRKRARDVPATSPREIEPADPSITPPGNLAHYTGEHDVHEEVLSWLRPMADEVPEPYRTALIKADFEQIPQRQLARDLRLSESGLKSRVQRGRKQLAEILRRCCEVEFSGQGRAVAFRRLRTCNCDK